MEWKKILRRKKLLGILAGLLVLQMLFFLYFAREEISYDDWDSYAWEDDSEINLFVAESEVIIYVDDEEEDYIDSFHDSIQAIVDQADSMSAISIFAQSNSFTSRNLQKTKEDYEPLLTVEPVRFDDTFLEAFFEDSLLNAFLVICGILIAFNLVDENKIGLRSMIYAAKNGRGRLVGHKLLALFGWDAVLVAVFCGTELLVSSVRYQGDLIGCLSYPVQSIELMGKLPWTISIGEFLLIYLAYRWLMLCVITLIAWLIMFTLDHLLLSMGLIGLFCIGEYLLATLIASTHPLAVLHYTSLWYLMSDASFFSEYRNLNIFGRPVNKNTIAAVGGLVLAAVLIAAAFLKGIKTYPCRFGISWLRNHLHRISDFLVQGYSRITEKLTVTGVEYFKLLFSQRGILVLVVFAFVLANQIEFRDIQWTREQSLYYAFLEKYDGEPDEQSAKYIEELSVQLDGVTEQLTDALEQYQAGEISYDDYFDTYLYYEGYAAERSLLTRLQTRTEYLQQLEESTGIKGWYINEYTYNNLLNAEESLLDVLLILCVVLLCSGIFAHEVSCGILPVMRAAKDGRNRLFRKKFTMAMGVTSFLYLLTEGLTVASVVYAYGLRTLGAPVQSLEALEFVPFSCSIGVFLLVLYVLRYLMLLVVAAFTCMISAWTSQKLTITISLILCAPSALALAGVDFLQYLSITRVLSIAEFLLQVRNVGIAAAVCAAFIALGIASARIGYRRWCN